MAPPQKRQALGKGLGALIPNKGTASTTTTRQQAVAPKLDKAIMTVGVEEIHPNRNQPRKTFDEGPLAELAASIETHGLMQPILVRKHGDGFEIIAGERRWRASQKAGLKAVPIVVRDLTDSDVFEWALIENIQREDLNPIEEAEAYKRLLEQNALTQEQVAERVGKDRSTIANSLRLLKLPTDVRRQVVAGAISMGHARALLALDSEDAMVKMSREIVKRGLSVREVERLVRNLRSEQKKEQKADPYAAIPGGLSAVQRVTDELMRSLGARVRIVPHGRKGKIEIEYASYDELNRLIEQMRG